MMRSRFPRDLFAELDRLQRDFNQFSEYSDYSPSIRGAGRRGYPALNVGGTPNSVEVYAFAPGLDPDKIELQIERGVLSIGGERVVDQPGTEQSTMHIDERFAGRFRRVVSLPDDANPNAVSATYRDGVLHISIGRRESSAPRRINVQ